MHAESICPFGPLTIRFDDSVLVPRPWTIEQSRWAADLLVDAPEGPVLELCSGVGHIGLAAVHGTDRSLVQVDADPRACELARTNAAEAGVDADVRNFAMAQAMADDERFALVVADPPWVPTEQVATFPEDPTWAIDGGSDGLLLVAECLAVGGRHLLEGGWMILQVGDQEQAEAAALLAPLHGLEGAEIRAFENGALLGLVRLPTG